jgi:hypothetical protein
MTYLTIRVENLPKSHGKHQGIWLVLQTKKANSPPVNGVFTVELNRAKNRKGEEHWIGDAITFHRDGRRFIYLGWLDDKHQMFGRIKLYLDQIPNLTPASDRVDVTINGTSKRGSCAFATAIVI